MLGCWNALYAYSYYAHIITGLYEEVYVFIYLFTKYVCIYKPGIKFLGGSAGKWCLYERIYSTSTRRVYNVSK